MNGRVHPNGFVNVLKPCGMSSNDAVGAVKRALGIRACGHMGTLDPGAAGVLPVAVGKASRLFDYLLEKEKEYRAVFVFGTTTDTLDSYGTVTETGGRVPGEAELRAALPALVGELEQTAPQFSAKKVNGRKGYQLARAGLSYEAPVKRVTISALRLLGPAEVPAALGPEYAERPAAYEFDLVCGGGTYVRSVARDLAARLGTVAYMRSLIRTRSGIFRIEDAVTPEELCEAAAAGAIPLVPADAAVADYPRVDLAAEWFDRFENGVPCPLERLAPGFAAPAGERPFRVYCRGEFFGMGVLAEEAVRLKSKIREPVKEKRRKTDCSSGGRQDD